MTRSVRPRIVAGFGRSGTTWIQDVMAQSNRLRAVFEPLHPAMLRNLNVDDDPRLQEYLEKYFFHKFHSLWVDYRTPRSSLLPRRKEPLSVKGLKRLLRLNRQAVRNIVKYRRQRSYEPRLTKLVRANMKLSWLKSTFDARIVYVVRHPAAVVLSKMHAPRTWRPREMIDRYRADSSWLSTVDKGTADLIKGPLTDVEAHVLHWCVEVGTALQQAKESEIPVVSYEELVEYGEPEWQRIRAALELERMPDDTLISRPSQQAWGTRARSAVDVRRYALWMQRLDEEAIAQVQSVLDATSMNIYSVSAALPVDVQPFREANTHSNNNRIEDESDFDQQ